jgi:hypothetical protein
VPGIVLVNVTRFPAEPVTFSIGVEYAEEAVSTILFGPVALKLAYVLVVLLLNVTAPDPPGETVTFPKVSAPPEPPAVNVFAEAEASEITIEEDACEAVRFVVVPVFHTVPVPVSVHVPDPIVNVLVPAPEPSKLSIVGLKPAASNVPVKAPMVMDVTVGL